MVTEFLSYAIPSSLANFISSLYTVIDGIFVLLLNLDLDLYNLMLF